MAFKIAARTILQLGAELISSDGIAFYELIKNSIDAGSQTVRIRIASVIPAETVNLCLDDLKELEKNSNTSDQHHKLAAIKRKALAETVTDTEFARACAEAVDISDSIDELTTALRNCSSIEVEDTGSGMSLETLQSVFLTVGTRSRYAERRKTEHRPADRPILGEKGIGRLSVMRLGRELEVQTSQTGELYWNNLAIDWGSFSHDSDTLLDEIEVEPYRGSKKKDPNKSGTILRIHRLEFNWTKAKMEAIIRDEFSKLVDPFSGDDRYKFFVRFNDEALERVSLDLEFLDFAHAELHGEYRIDKEEGPVFSGKMSYNRYGKKKSFSLSGTHLLTSVSPSSLYDIKSVGPFRFDLYWFNRRDIKDTAGVEAPYVGNQVRIWAGGPMVYRDGFRVNPYGGPDDDWLGLDKKAFASGGYKLNRNQLIGKVSISSIRNAALLDQTNREGIRESPERRALENLLRTVISTEFRNFLNAVEKEVTPLEPLSVDALKQSSDRSIKAVQHAWADLRRRFPALREERQLIGQMEEAIDDLTALLERAHGVVLAYEKGRNDLVQLAGIGLMVELIGHELTRATEHALREVTRSRRLHSTAGLDASLESLSVQLKTINKRIRVLDPLSPSGRQTKEDFDLIGWVSDLFSTHEAQFRRHEIQARLDVVGSTKSGGLQVRAVKGMITQIVENLTANSVYWLKAEEIARPNFKPRLSVAIDVAKRTLAVEDNGPGVEVERSDDIFQPFVTSKPPGEGKGLGLYIAREMAHYHGCELYLAPPSRRSKRSNTFIFDFANILR
jgi:signal transduction histidine kinase